MFQIFLKAFSLILCRLEKSLKKRPIRTYCADFDFIPPELFKIREDYLIVCMHQLLFEVWPQECKPTYWSLSVLCPVLKKGDPAVYANYCCISLLNAAFKILTSILCERLKPFIGQLIGSYQCGFRPGKFTIYQIFTLCQILVRTPQKETETFFISLFQKRLQEIILYSHV